MKVKKNRFGKIASGAILGAMSIVTMLNCVGSGNPDVAKKNDLVVLGMLVQDSSEKDLQVMAGKKFIESSNRTSSGNSNLQGSKAIKASQQSSQDFDKADLKELTSKLSKTQITKIKEELPKNIQLLDSATQGNLNNSLSSIENPELFANITIGTYPQPTVDNNIHLSKSKEDLRAAFLWNPGGPTGWYCNSPIYGIMGPNPDFWFSSFVCAFAQGKLILVIGSSCYLINASFDDYCR